MNPCKCGNEITHNRQRKICDDCIKKEQREYYHFKKEIYNQNKKDKRKENKVLDSRVCVICKVEFKTTHAIKCTCGYECGNVHRKNLARQNYHNKKVTLGNTK